MLDLRFFKYTKQQFKHWRFIFPCHWNDNNFEISVTKYSTWEAHVTTARSQIQWKNRVNMTANPTPVRAGQRFLNILVGVNAEYCPKVISRSNMGTPNRRKTIRYTKMKTTPPYFRVKMGNSQRLWAPEKRNENEVFIRTFQKQTLGLQWSKNQKFESYMFTLNWCINIFLNISFLTTIFYPRQLTINH